MHALLLALLVGHGAFHSGKPGGSSSAAGFFNRNSVLFQGSNNFATAGTGAMSDVDVNMHTTDFAAAAWFKATSLAAIDVVFSKCDLSGSVTVHHMAGVNTNGSVYGYFGGLGNTASGAGLVTTNTWHLIGIGAVAGTGFVWLDGVNVTPASGVTAGTGLATGVPFAIGACVQADTVNSGRNFTGNIDEVSYWQATFTSADWLQLYNNGKPADLRKHGKSNGLRHWFRVDGNTFPTLVDVIGGATMTMTNMIAGDITTTVP